MENILNTLIHELQHCRVAYSNKDKDVLNLNPTNIYNKITELPKLCRDILYMMSEDEQSSHIQQIYHYVLTHPEINDIDINDNTLETISGLKQFYTSYTAIYNYKQDIRNNSYLQNIILNLGLKFKENFKFRNSKLTKQYVNDVLNDTAEYDGSIFRYMMEFIYSKIQEYQRKVARTIYFAIEDRDNKYTEKY